MDASVGSIADDLREPRPLDKLRSKAPQRPRGERLRWGWVGLTRTCSRHRAAGYSLHIARVIANATAGSFKAGASK